MNEREIAEVAALIAGARAGLTPPVDARAGMPRPRDLAEAFRVQDAVAARLGWAVGGWKVGASSPSGPINCARMYRRAMVDGATRPAVVAGGDYPLRLIEAEVAFSFAHDLPPRATPYDEADVAAAIAGCHPAIELLASRFADPDAVEPLTALADDNSHGGFIHGPARADWRGIDLTAQRLVVTVGDAPAFDFVGANPAGPAMRLLLWLANEGSARAGGLKAGDIVTTGSWIGKHPVPADTPVTARFADLGEVGVTFSDRSIA